LQKEEFSLYQTKLGVPSRKQRCTPCEVEPYPDEYFDFEVNLEDAGREAVMDEAVRRAIEQARKTMNEDIGGLFEECRESGKAIY